MKHFVLFILVLVFSCLYGGCSKQEQKGKLTKGPHPINLSIEYENYVNPEELELKVECTYAFLSEDEQDYVVIVRKANEFMEEVERYFTVRANDVGAVEYFTVKEGVEGEWVFEVYCITNNTVPDAPPGIIISRD